MQSPAILEKPLKALSMSEAEYAKLILQQLISYSNDEAYTMVDKIQKARLLYALAELYNCDEPEKAAKCYSSALNCLQQGGLDLSLKKWLELVSVRMKE